MGIEIMYDIPCVIFAGGKSSRMGEDKSLLPFGDFDTLTEFQLSRLNKIFKTVYISCKDSTNFDFKANFIEDIKTDSIYAPTAGFVAIFDKLKDEKFFVLSVDSPFVGESEIKEIILNDNKEVDATIAKTEFGIQPMCGIYHRSLESKFTEMLESNNHKLGFLLKSSNTTFINFENEKPFLNLNHPHEYEEALNFLQNHRWMQIAYDEATKGMLANDGGPFGAIIIKDEKVIATAHNEVLKTKDSTAHAEMNAIRKACKELDSFDLSGAILYTSCEPCPMCLGAIFWARISKVYYGTTKEDAARGGFDDERFYEMLSGKNNDLTLEQIEHQKGAELFDKWLEKNDREIY
ncbi:MAG: molybdenum cofactor guanylyltransferase MobA [Campylobacterota bacterium]|nr:molybdenum cofactor guanylyltransferase MobA [Campylobacterota bacterium]